MYGIFFATISATLLGFYFFFQDKAVANGITPIIGAMLIQVFGFVLGFIVFGFQKLNGVEMHITKEALQWIALVGFLVVLVDLFALKAFTSGTDVSIIGPIITGGSIATATIVGVILAGEGLSMVKLFGISLILAGGIILACVNT